MVSTSIIHVITWITTHLPIRPRRDGRLSCPGWLNHSGPLTHEVVTSDVNKAISIKAKAKALIPKAKAKDNQFVSRPGQGQGRVFARARQTTP